MTQFNQDEFDMMIGRLDYILSQMIGYAKTPKLSEINNQTLKHHAEDMLGAANKVLELIKENK